VNDLWIIECRNPDGTLNFEGPQPEDVFGFGAIRGMTDDAMAKIVYARRPDAILHGSEIANWPSYINLGWKARRKTW